MLTRLEVDGFKNLLDVQVDFGPYTCVVGPNAVGKSNLFDAIRFLALLADGPIASAAAEVRVAGGRRADPRGLFWSEAGTSSPVIRLAAEMIVPKVVRDDFGREAKATTTYLRYEVELAYVGAQDDGGFGRVELRREQLTHMLKSQAGRRLRFPHSPPLFREEAVDGHRAGKAYISTTLDGDAPVVQVHQDGGSRGQPKEAALRAQSTVVGSTSDASYPTVLAARREMQSWRTLGLEPARLRAPDELDMVTPGTSLSADGGHLPYQLYTLAHPRPPTDLVGEARARWVADREATVYASVAARLARLIQVYGIRVDRDDRRGLLTVQLQEARGGAFRDARLVSDGTLRFLALAVMEQDDRVGGLVCMEEPENGIHPQRVGAMLDLVRGLAVDPFAPLGAENPLRQVIVNTHSLQYLRLHEDPGEVVFAEPVAVMRDGVRARALTLRPIVGSWRAGADASPVSWDYVKNYLELLEGQQSPLFRRESA